MDPLTLGIAVFFALCWAGREVGKAVADGYRSGAAAGRAKTQKLRGSDHIGDNMIGAALDGIGAVIGGTVRGARAVGGAVGRGAEKGWQAGKAKGQQIREDAKANGRPRWREAADWARDRVQGRPREGHRSMRQRLRDWWNEGRDGGEQTDRPDDPPTGGGSGTGGPQPPPPGPTDPPTPPEPIADGQPSPPELRTPPHADLPAEPERPAAHACPHTTTVTDRSSGAIKCSDCGELLVHAVAPETPGGDMPTATKPPTGEVQTYTQAKQAAAAFYGQITQFQTKATDAKTKCEEMETAVRGLHERLAAGGLGQDTMGPIGGALETVAAMVRSAGQLVAYTADDISAANRVDAALTTHAGIAEAAATNKDGGDRQFHGGAAEKK